jgi:hypothetical protein
VKPLPDFGREGLRDHPPLEDPDEEASPQPLFGLEGYWDTGRYAGCDNNDDDDEGLLYEPDWALPEDDPPPRPPPLPPPFLFQSSSDAEISASLVSIRTVLELSSNALPPSGCGSALIDDVSAVKTSNVFWNFIATNCCHAAEVRLFLVEYELFQIM